MSLFLLVFELFAPQLNSVGARERLAHLLSAEPSELLLDPAEALRLTTEAYRLWAVAAGYGQACEMFVWVNASKCTPFQSAKHTGSEAAFLLFSIVSLIT